MGEYIHIFPASRFDESCHRQAPISLHPVKGCPVLFEREADLGPEHFGVEKKTFCLCGTSNLEPLYVQPLADINTYRKF